MITGAHTIIYSRNADADRAFLKDVLGFPHVDVGGGWLIFGLPPSEVAVHPDADDSHELYLMTDDVTALIGAMQAKGVACDPPSMQPWGLLTSVAMPGGSKLGIYEPRHARPKQHEPAGAKKAAAPAKKKAAAPAKKKAARPVAAKKSATSKSTSKSKSKPKPNSKKR
jgi:hypothetical protein